MTKEDFKDLSRGDLIRHVTSSESLIVDHNHGDVVLALRSHTVTNPDEWHLVAKADYKLNHDVMRDLSRQDTFFVRRHNKE